MEIDGDDLRNTTNDCVTARKAAAIPSAITEGDDPFRARRRMIRALQRLAHILGHGTGNKQHIGMPRRGDEANSKSFEIVKRVVEGVDLELAAVTRAGIDTADGQAATPSS